MKNRLKAVLCLATALSVLSGCKGETQPEIPIIDMGGVHSAESGGDDISGMPTDSSVTPDIETASSGVHRGETDVVSKIRDEIPEESDSSEAVSGISPQEPLPEDNPAASSPESMASTAGTPEVTTAVTTTSAAASAVTSTADTTTASSTTTGTTSSSLTEAYDPAEIGTNSYTPINYSEVKGVWISYIELSEMLMGKSRDSFKSAISQAYDNCVELGLNTVYVHVRSHGDAYYKSALFPWSKYAAGKHGGSLDFDPLEIMINEAHSRGLSFQAWINPLRGCAVNEISGGQGYQLYSWANGAGTAGNYVVPVGSYYYFNPAYDEVIEYIADGAAEIVANYDVDGLHIDDYFYPTTDASFDSAAYSQSGYESISAFRFANCDKLVSTLYSAVKSANSRALFGVSCQGSMNNNYNMMYADVKKWCTTDGYLDYIMPQIYYGFNNSTEPFDECVSTWDALAASGKIPLIVGLSASKIGLEDTWAGAGKNEWITDSNILSRQLRSSLEQRSYGGICLYSYRSVFTPDSMVREQVEKEISSLKSVLNE